MTTCVFFSFIVFVFVCASSEAKRGDIQDLTTTRFLTDCVTEHNGLRMAHCAPLLKVDKTLVKIAKTRALELAKSDGAHFAAIRRTKNFGQNVHWYTGKKAASINCRNVVRNWYSEQRNFDWTHEEQKTGITGHFTQLIWSSSTKIGCASVLSNGPRGGAFTVCVYYPLGNIRSFFTENTMSKEMCDYRLASGSHRNYEELTNATWMHECLREHNVIRALHGADALTLDAKIIEYARRRAIQMASSDYANFGHAYGTPYGENLHWGRRRSGAAIKCAEPIELWYREKSYYDWNNRTSHMGTVGHFAQMVWKRSKRMGCAQVASLGQHGGTFTVCAYDPWDILATSEDQKKNVDRMKVMVTTKSRDVQVEDDEEEQDDPEVGEDYYVKGESSHERVKNQTKAEPETEVETTTKDIDLNETEKIDLSEWYPNRKPPMDEPNDGDIPDTFFDIQGKQVKDEGQDEQLVENDTQEPLIDLNEWYHGPKAKELSKLKSPDELNEFAPEEFPILKVKSEPVGRSTFQLPEPEYEDDNKKSVKKQL